MNKLILDGVEYGLSDSLVAKLKEEMAINDAVRHKPGAFDRVEGEQYCHTDIYGGVTKYIDRGDNVDSALYAVANYCRDEELMDQRALHETLNRLLWRYSEMHGGDSPWDTVNNNHHFICKCGSSGLTVMYAVETKAPGMVYFKDKKTARSAITEVIKPFLAEHPEFVW